ncbi:MAG: hypothetical protein Kow0077_21880 [Anaerolineae bacterium]
MVKKAQSRISPVWWLSVAILVLVVTVLYGIVLFNQVYLRPYDYPTHISWARQLFQGDFEFHPGGVKIGAAYRPNFLFQALVSGIMSLTGSDAQLSGMAVGLLANLILALSLHALFYMDFARSERVISGFVAVALAVIVLLLGPVSFLTWHRANLYLGYIAPTVYHNPTLTLLRPLALLQFLCLVKGFDDVSTGRQPLLVLVTALLTVVSVYAKPSYIICLLPAAGLAMVVQWLRKQPVDWLFIGAGIIVPGFVVLILQYQFTYIANTDNNVIFAPLLAARTMESVHILPKLILSFVFPAAVSILYWPRVARSHAFVLAWLVAFVALAYAYLLAESGMVGDGNFLWGAQVSLFILMVVALRFFVQQIIASGQPRISLRNGLLVGALLLHLIPGIVWYYAEALTLEHWW